MAIAAGIVGNTGKVTSITSIEMPAHSCCPAVSNGPHDFEDMQRLRMVKTIRFTILTEYVL
jgi:hypothetical protein